MSTMFKRSIVCRSGSVSTRYHRIKYGAELYAVKFMIGLALLSALLWAPQIWAQTATNSVTPLLASPLASPDSTQAPLKRPTLKRGFSVTPTLGIITCFPTDAVSDCSNTYPGFLAGGSLEYRWTYVGLSIDGDYGFLWVGGEGDVDSNIEHIGLTIKGYYPLSLHYDLSVGVGLGYGEVSVSESQSGSEASWASLWSDLRIQAGVLIALTAHLSLDLSLLWMSHLKGERCLSFQRAGPCSAIADLGETRGSVASHLGLLSGLRYTF